MGNIEQYKDCRNHEQSVRKTIFDFYDAFYLRKRLLLYSFFTTSFQIEVPLNYFLIHSDYSIDLGNLAEIKKIEVHKEENIAFAEIIIDIKNKKKNIRIELKSDFGGWKIEGRRIFQRHYI